MKVICELVEANVNNITVLLIWVNFFQAATLYIPETKSWVAFGLSLFYFMLLINALNQTALPPLEVFPYFVLLDVSLEVNFLSLFIDEVIREGQDHKLL